MAPLTPIAPSCVHAPDKAAHNQAHHHIDHFPQGPLPEGVAPRLYDVTLRLDPNSREFVGHTSIAIELLEPHRHVFLHAEHLEFARVVAQSSEGRNHHVEIAETPVVGLVRLSFEPPLPAGMATLSFGHRAPYSTTLDGLFVTERDAKRYVFSQMQFLSARKVFPCFDEPRFKAPMELTLIVPKGLLALSNSNVLARQQTEGHTLGEQVPEGFERLVFEPTPPLPTYLYAMAVGPFDEEVQTLPISPQRPYPLQLRGVAVSGAGNKLGQALSHVAPLLLNLEGFVNLPYTFGKLDIVAVPNFAMQGMENAGAIALRDWLMLWDPKRTSYEQRRTFEMVMAHELTHQWFGDFVTMAWWDDLWLNEAFATWSGLKAVGQVRPHMAMDAELWAGMDQAMTQDGLVGARRVRQPALNRDDIYNSADVITFQKGAGILRMFEHYLGEEAMQAGVQAYLRQFPFRSADAANFLSTLSRTARRPELPEAMGTFLQQTGVPDITVRWQCRSHAQASAIVTQNRWVPQGSAINSSSLWQVPVCLRMGTHNGDTQEVCRLLKGGEMGFALPACPTWLIPNAQGVGYYRWHVEPEQLGAVTLALHEHHASEPESLAIVDGLWAAMQAGSLAADDVLPEIVRALSNTHPRVGRRALVLLRQALELFVAPEELPHVAGRLRPKLIALRERIEAAVRKLEGRIGQAARHNDVGESAYDELGEMRLWLRDVTFLLAQQLGDERLREEFVHDGVRRLERMVAPSQDNNAALSPLPRALLDNDNSATSSAMALAGDALGPAFVSRIEAALALNLGATERHVLIAALAGMRSLPSAAAVRALALTTRIEGSETLRLIEQQMGATQLRAQTWRWLSEQLVPLQARLSTRDRLRLFRLMGQLCEPGDSQRIAELLTPQLHSVEGGARILAEAREASELCSTLKVEQAQAARRFLFGQAKTPPDAHVP